MSNQRPTGVTILAVLQIIGGLLSLLFGLSGLLFGGAMVATDAAEATGAPLDMGPVMMTVGIASVIIGLIGLIAGYGLFTLQGWGWLMAIVFAAANVLRNLVSLVQGINVPGAIIGIVVSGLIIYYLYRPNVKRAFGKA
jgi:uncharacterized membrane protein (DUF2068 family)